MALVVAAQPGPDDPNLPAEEVLIDIIGRRAHRPPAKPTGLSIAAAVRGIDRDCSASKVRLACACMTKQPDNFMTWLRHHHERIGIERFYLRVEDTQGLASLLSRPPWSELVCVTYHDEQHNVRDNGPAQTARQTTLVDASIRDARSRGLTHILHLVRSLATHVTPRNWPLCGPSILLHACEWQDDDELLYAPSGLNVLHEELAAIEARGYTSAHALTLEALVPSVACTAPFDEVTDHLKTPACRLPSIL